MTEQEWMQEGMDFRLFFLRFIRKIWIVAVCAVIGAALFGGAYLVRHVVYAPAREYEALSRYYITFADERGKDYYNDYTWNELAASDPILDYTMSLLPDGYEKEEVQMSVEAKIPSDVRVLSTIVTTKNPEQTMEIARATERSICHFGEIIPEIAKIEVILDAEVKPVIVNLYTLRMVLLGLMTGLLTGLFVVVFRLILDTSVSLDREAGKRYGLAVLGCFYRGELEGLAKKQTGGTEAQRPLHHRELLENLEALAAGRQKVVPLTDEENKAAKAAVEWMNASGSVVRAEAAASCLDHPEEYRNLCGADGVILLIRCSAGRGCLVYKEIEQLKQRGCHISGLVLYEADRNLFAQYYFGSGVKRTGKGRKQTDEE